MHGRRNDGYGKDAHLKRWKYDTSKLARRALELGLTASKIAEESGLTKQTVGAILRAGKQPSPNTALKLAKVLQIDLATAVIEEGDAA